MEQPGIAGFLVHRKMTAETKPPMGEGSAAEFIEALMVA